MIPSERIFLNVKSVTASFWICHFRSFLKDEISWNKENKTTVCSITIYNYTARARAYTILAKWPEADGIFITDNPNIKDNNILPIIFIFLFICILYN